MWSMWLRLRLSVQRPRIDPLVQETRFHMPQLKDSHVTTKSLHATTKTD